MRYFMMFKPASDDAEAGISPSAEYRVRMASFIEEQVKAGVVLATEGLQASSNGARIRLQGKRLSVNDGPFAETKEVVAGYAVIRAGSKQEAIEHAKRFLEVAGEGEVEIRPIYEG